MKKVVHELQERLDADPRCLNAKSYADIARELGRSVSAVRVAWRELGLPPALNATQARIWRRVVELRRQGFTVRSVAKELGTSSALVFQVIRKQLGRRANRFVERAADRFYRRKYTRGRKVRPALWKRDIKEHGYMGFEFTKGYWKRYYKMWKNKRRKDCPVDDDGRPDYVATLLRR